MSEWATRRNLVAVDLGTEWLAAGSTARLPETLTDGRPSAAEHGSAMVGGDDGVDGLDRGEVADDAVAHDGDATPESMSA